VVSVMNPYGRILGFLDRSRYFLLSSHVLQKKGFLKICVFSEEILKGKVVPVT
jgi:hypothetical protein